MTRRVLDIVGERGGVTDSGLIPKRPALVHGQLKDTLRISYLYDMLQSMMPLILMMLAAVPVVFMTPA